jgi:lysozyme family protein
MLFTPTARKGYDRLYSTMTISPDRLPFVERVCKKIVDGEKRYSAVAEVVRVPWVLIGALHQMESSCDFGAHLHNGDPLSARTKRVPKGRPAKGSPPFSWEESAIDALSSPPHDLGKVEAWSVARMLYEAEKYNGWGYVGKGVNSPYVWSFTDQYRKGKYVSDGKFSYNAVSKQCGVAPILKTLEKQGHVMTELLALLPIIRKIAPTAASKLLGREAGVVVEALAEALQIAGADHAEVARALEEAPTSRAAEALAAVEETLNPAKAADAGNAASRLSPNGVLVDPEASVAKALVSALLFVVSMVLLRNVPAANSISEALAPAVTGLVTLIGGGVMPWLLHRSISNANANTLAALGE